MRNVERPSVDNFQFRTLTPMEGMNLIKPLCIEEVKVAV